MQLPTSYSKSHPLRLHYPVSHVHNHAILLKKMPWRIRNSSQHKSHSQPCQLDTTRILIPQQLVIPYRPHDQIAIQPILHPPMILLILLNPMPVPCCWAISSFFKLPHQPTSTFIRYQSVSSYLHHLTPSFPPSAVTLPTIVCQSPLYKPLTLDYQNQYNEVFKIK